MEDFKDNETLEFDLSTCDLEPIHTPGRIQPFGALLAGPMDLSKIEYCSANVDGCFGQTPDEILGRSIMDLLPSQVVHDLRNLLSASTARSQRERLGVYELPGGYFEVYAHCNPASQAVVEFEPYAVNDDSNGPTPIDYMRKFLSSASTQTTIAGLLNVSVAGLQALTGYDRVMAYRYDENGDGEVVAEARTGKADSFLGLRYPAWDVPEQARALQVKNPLRMLVDVKQEPIPILCQNADAVPLDISLAHLRGVSPIHVEYLSNMGVGASLTVGLVVEGRLWGMFSCHHMGPKVISSDLRIAVELFGQMISLVIKQKLDIETVSMRRLAAEAREKVLADTDAKTDLLHSFPKLAPILAQVIDCDGLSIIQEGKVLRHGSTPEGDAIRRFEQIRPGEEDVIEPINNLTNTGKMDDCALNDSGGALLIRATAAYPMQLVYFRDEKARKIKWAGRPEKEMEAGPLGPRITPRGSFDAYMEMQKGFCDDWTDSDLAAARELQVMLTQITAKGERAQLERHRDLVSHQRQQDLMIAELNHRVKNILALIRSLSRQAKASSASLESYALALEQRIAALAAAHDLAVSNTMQGVSLRGILKTELSPYLEAENSQVLMTGPLIGLRADVAPMIALVLHEIVSNAVKYGALSDPDGIVRVRWKEQEGRLHFTWQEIGGPRVTPPERHGFGRSLIEKAIPYELDGVAELRFEEDGVQFSFDLPDDALVELDRENETRIVGSVAKIERVATGKRALLVEDNVVLAMDMVESLTRLGTDSVETAASLETAMSEAARPVYDFVILDMNLRGTVSFDVARLLAKRNVPFIFVTGYGSSLDVPADLAAFPILTKPIDEGTLSREIERILS